MSYTKGTEIVGAILNILEKDYDITELENCGQPTCDEIARRMPLLNAAPKLLEACKIFASSHKVLDVKNNHIAIHLPYTEYRKAQLMAAIAEAEKL